MNVMRSWNATSLLYELLSLMLSLPDDWNYNMHDIYKMVLIASFSFIAVLGNLIREYLPFNLLFVIFVINVGAVLIRIYLNNKNVGY